MGWIVMMALMTLIAVGIFMVGALGLVYTSTRVRNAESPTGYSTTKHRIRLPLMLGAFIGWLLITVISTGLSSYEQVEAGHVGVVRQFGEITGTISEGPHFIPPWQSVMSVNIQTRSTSFGTGEDFGYPRIEAASSETQDVFYAATLNWHVDPANVDKLIREHSENYFLAIDVPARVEQHFKQIVVEYTSIEATTQRAIIRDRITQSLREELADFYIDITSIQINNISYQAAFNAAIEEKQVATQDALAAAERVKIAEQDAARTEAVAKGDAARIRETAIGNAAATVAKAKADAEATVLRATADAEAVRLRGEAEADANTVIAASLTTDLIRLRTAELLPGTTVFLPADGTFNLMDIAAVLASEKH